MPPSPNRDCPFSGLRFGLLASPFFLFLRLGCFRRIVFFLSEHIACSGLLVSTAMLQPASVPCPLIRGSTDHVGY